MPKKTYEQNTHHYWLRDIVHEQQFSIVCSEWDGWIIDGLNVDNDDVCGIGWGDFWVCLVLVHCDVEVLHSCTISAWSVSQAESKQDQTGVKKQDDHSEEDTIYHDHYFSKI